ncbi:MAG: tetratricopeptide repeat protein [Bryobacterales bacterium]|nr:tetratricopeptide repeat protein [Bryobacterales bacterium]
MQPAKVIPLSAGYRSAHREDSNAQRLWEEGNVEAAVAAWRELLQKDGESIEFRKKTARALMFLEQWEAAVQEWNLCLALEPDSADLLARIGVCHLHTGEQSSAWMLLQQALRLESSHRLAAAALLTRPVQRYGLRVVQTGILTLDESEEGSCSGYPVSGDLYQQARLRMENHQLDAAVELLEEAVWIDPLHAPSLFALGWIEDSRGRARWARHFYERAVRSAPQEWRGHYNLARLCAASGDDGRARLHLERTILLKPDELDAIWLLAQVCERQLDIGEAVVWLEHLRKADPRNAEACVALARVDPGRIHTHLEAAVAMGCRRYEVLFNLGVARWRAGDTGGAEVCWRDAAALPGSGPEAAHALSALALSGDHCQDAGGWLGQHPHAGLLLLLAHLYESNGEAERSREAWRQAIELEPEMSRRYFG